MRIRLYLALALSAVVVVPALAAVNVTGTWNGRIVVDMKQLPKPKSPQEQQQMDQQLAMVKKLTLAITLRPNHTCTMTSKGASNANHTLDGKWSIVGNVVTVTVIKEDGKPGPNGQTQTHKLTLSKDGNTLSMGVGNAKGVSLTFRRK